MNVGELRQFLDNYSDDTPVLKDEGDERYAEIGPFVDSANPVLGRLWKPVVPEAGVSTTVVVI